MEMLWFGNWGRPVIGFPTSGGGFRELEDFGLVRALAGKIEAGEIQLCCVDSVDRESWYNNRAHPADRVRRHDQFDRYVRDEVLPFVAHRAQRDDVVLYGASFGAYHAMNLACRYPDRIGRAIAFSGVFDVHRFLHGYWDDLCYFHCPTAYVPNMDGAMAGRLSNVDLVVATGEHDHLAHNTREFTGMLASRGVPVVGEIWQGQFGHDWPFWSQHLPRFLP
ncbi:MAG: esterase [Gemmatimonadetes bacterium]|nr:esterase [Gemmatimonadota bacterium]